MKLQYYTVDVFTKQQFGGNPLAVITDATKLSANQMQLIASEFNFSETAFVVQSNTESGEYNIRIFTPQTELPFAGHPTVGTAFALGLHNRPKKSENFTFYEEAGSFPVTLKWDEDDLHRCAFKAPKLPFRKEGQAGPGLLAEVLGLDRSQIQSSPFEPAIYSAGVPFAVIPVQSREALKNIALDLDRWQKILQPTLFQNIYVVCPLDDSYHEWAVRMFAPALGVIEDPATGAAATAFAGYLAEFTPDTTDLSTVTIHQGAEINRPSTIYLNIERNGNTCSSVTVSGDCVLTAKGTFYLQSQD